MDGHCHLGPRKASFVGLRVWICTVTTDIAASFKMFQLHLEISPAQVGNLLPNFSAA